MTNAASIFMSNFKTLTVVFQDIVQPPKTENQVPWDNCEPAWAQNVATSPMAATPSIKKYTYKAPLDLNVAPGDFVIVMANKQLKAVRVVSVGTIAEIDPSASYDYKWIVGRADVEGYFARVDADAVFQAKLKEIDRIRQREALIAQYRNNLPEGSEALREFEALLQNTNSIQSTAVLGATLQAVQNPPADK